LCILLLNEERLLRWRPSWISMIMMLFFVWEEMAPFTKSSMDWKVEQMAVLLLQNWQLEQFQRVRSLVDTPLTYRIWYFQVGRNLCLGNALSVSLYGNCHPTYAAWQAVKGIYFLYITANVAKTILADLMSVAQVADDEAPTGPPIWAFMSISYGWIAHADIHTERLRYPLPPSSLT